jgi:NhaA family Na+:H+ antiporter
MFMLIEGLKKFIRYEASAGILLFIAAMLALVIDNTPWAHYYQDLLTTHVHWGFKGFLLDKPMLMWVNDGFMAIFFLLVGLEVKREMTTGELRSLPDALLPAIAAVGGMVLPALVYLAVTHPDQDLMRGWAIPAATDIAFSLGVLALLSQRIPPSVKIFLTALAIFDDVGAITIIAFFYTDELSMTMLIGALVCFLVLLFLNRMTVEKNWPYVFFGWLLWLCVLKSGVHATLAGIILAFVIPIKKRSGKPSKMLERWEQTLHPWVSYGVLPIFGFANAGIRFADMKLSALWSSVTLACILGLFLGKQVGITGATWLAVKARIAELPTAFSMKGIWAVSVLAGIGFTMSLFIGSLTFAESGVDMMSKIRLGVMIGSLFSGFVGYFALRIIYKDHQQP